VLLAPPPTLKLEDHPLSVARNCLLDIFAATLHTWRPSPPSATWGRAMPWWEGTQLTRPKIHLIIILWHDGWKPEWWSRGRRPLLSNGSEITCPVQWITVKGSLPGKRFLNTRFRDKGFIKSSKGNLGGGDLYSGRVAVINGSAFRDQIHTRVEAGSNTSTVTLRVVRGDEKGSLTSETVNYGR
jgi:hypothetical protein